MTPQRDRVSQLPEALMLGVSIAIAVVIALLAYWSGQAANAEREQLDTTQQVAKLNADLLSALKDAETGQRGFLLTGQERYLEPYNQAVASIPQTIERLASATQNRSEQRAQVGMLQPLVSQKLAELQSTIDLRRANKISEALAIVQTDRGKEYMDRIRVVCSEIEGTAESRLRQFEANAEKSELNLRLASIGGSLVLAAFLAISTITVFQATTKRDQLLHQTYASEKLLATTLSGIADGVIATDANARITFINPAAQQMSGWTESEAIGIQINCVFAIANEITGLKADNPLERALEHGEPVRLANHTNLISKNGLNSRSMTAPRRSKMKTARSSVRSSFSATSLQSAKRRNNFEARTRSCSNLSTQPRTICVRQ